MHKEYPTRLDEKEYVNIVTFRAAPLIQYLEQNKQWDFALWVQNNF